MKKVFILFLSKWYCRVQVAIGLCLAMLFICVSPVITSQALDEYDQNLYPVKSSRILADDQTVSKDVGIADANFSLMQSNVTGGLMYVDYVLNLVDNALTHVDSYFTQHINISYNKNNVRNLLVSGDNGYFIDRDKFLNVYLVIDSNYNGQIWFQYNKGYMGFTNMPYTVDNSSSDTTAIYYWFDYSSLNFATSIFYEDKYFDIVAIPNSEVLLFKPSILYGNLNNSESFSNINYIDWINSWYDSYTNANRFFKYESNSTVTIEYALKSSYILPLYIDSDIYFPLSFVSPYNSSYEIHGDIVYNGILSLKLLYTPALGQISGDYFDSNLWYAGEFQSGIKGTTFPDPIVTPIPTFAPFVTPTPFPTFTVNATLTPIAIPNDPFISTGLGDPVSVVYGVVGYLHQVLSLNQFNFISTVMQYLYNSDIFFQILLFMIPGVVLLVFMIGRLKRK